MFWGPISQKPWKIVQARKAIFISSVSENGEGYVPKASCMKGTSVHIKNMWIKQFCNFKV